jgi:F-type H+-transporting ATPase subunit b
MIKPLGRFLEERAQSIKIEIDVAESNRVESEAVLETQKKALRDARQEAKQIRQDAEENMKKEREKRLEEVKEESDKLLQNAHKELNQDIKKVKQQLLSETGELAVMLTKKILKREVSEKDQKKLVTEALSQK